MKNTHKNQTLGMSIGMCMGMSIGMTIGSTVFDNMTLGMCFGLSIGIEIGSALGALKDSKINEQLKEQGYTIKEIRSLEGGYEILLTNKVGEETISAIDTDTMEEQEFCVGDMVYIDEEGNLEQAYDKEDEEE